MTRIYSSKMNRKQVSLVISLFCSPVCLSGGRREGEAKTGLHFVCMWAHLVQDFLNQNQTGNSKCSAQCSGSRGPWPLSSARRSTGTAPIKDVSCNPLSLVTYSFDHGCLWFWNEEQFLKQLDQDQGRLWLLYRLSDMDFVTDMKTCALVWAWWRWRFLSRSTAVLATDNAFEGTLFDHWLTSFAVIKL